MAIVQISRIQNRRGVFSDLPQLASGELGWSIDTGQLFIGNGTIAEGASSVGNTEILTTNTDVFSLISSYTYKGNQSLAVTTGASSNAPISRTIQQKQDDFASVKDFGANGDGVTDDKDVCPNTPDGVTVDDKGCPAPLFIEKTTFIENAFPNPTDNILTVTIKKNIKKGIIPAFNKLIFSNLLTVLSSFFNGGPSSGWSLHLT